MTSTFHNLSAREYELLDLHLEGLCPKEIATRLGVSVKTVGVHIWNITQKLNKAGLRIQVTRQVVPIQERKAQ